MLFIIMTTTRAGYSHVPTIVSRGDALEHSNELCVVADLYSETLCALRHASPSH